MPIRPENLARYPPDWKAISRQIKERAGWCCEGSPDFPDCRRAHNAIGYVTDSGAWRELDAPGTMRPARWSESGTPPRTSNTAISPR